MTPFEDEWGQAPSVQSMRRVFSRMEPAQQELLGRSSISPFDGRLRGWREEARKLFEKVWTLVTRKGLVVSEEELARLYTLCFVRVLRASGIKVHGEVFPGDDKIIGFLDEGLR